MINIDLHCSTCVSSVIRSYYYCYHLIQRMVNQSARDHHLMCTVVVILSIVKAFIIHPIIVVDLLASYSYLHINRVLSVSIKVFIYSYVIRKVVSEERQFNTPQVPRILSKLICTAVEGSIWNEGDNFDIRPTIRLNDSVNHYSIHNEHQGDCKTYFNCYRNQVISRDQNRIKRTSSLYSQVE